MYEPRFYRHWIKDDDLVSFEVGVKQTDLYIRSRRNLKDKALDSVLKHRGPLESYIGHHPLFLTTLDPYQAEAEAPAIVKEMARVSQLTGVGPMAAVAGAIAEAVGMDLLAFSPEVIVENGGDIFLKISKKRLVGIYAGQSSFTKKIALEIMPRETPLGVCTSSGTVGHSLSLGSADAVIVLSPSTALADAAATALGNMVKAAADIPQAIERAQSIDGLRGLVIIVGDEMGVWGKVKIVSLG
ncbi:MAG TPA: UPF0280 family protein [Dehalococcoidia bacterium]|nr:UPF0280 family protein [Dehalococcoidia bacterium]